MRREPAVARSELRRDLVIGDDDRIGVEPLVADERQRLFDVNDRANPSSNVLIPLT